MATPVYSAAQAGIVGNAGAIAASAQVDQFLGTHADTIVYQGASILTPNGTGGTAWNYQLSTQDIDQPFAMSGTAIGRVAIPLLPVGNGADLLVSLCADNSGTPGTMLSQTRVPASWITQLAAVSGSSGPSNGSPSVQYTGNPLAAAQFNSFHMSAPATKSWPYPTSGTGGPSTFPSSTYVGDEFVQVGGSVGSTLYNNVYTIPYNANGTLAPAVVQPAFPSVTDGSATGAAYTDSSGNQTLFVVGGCETPNVPVSAVYAASMDASTGNINSWSQQTSLPYATNLAGAVASNGYLYVLGGPFSTTPTTNVYYAAISNGQIGSWTATTPLPLALSAFFTVVSNGFLFIIGGVTPSTIGLSTVYYAPLLANGAIGAWRAGPPLSVTLYQASGLPVITAGGYGIIVNGSATLSMLGVGPGGPDSAWQTANLFLGGDFIAAAGSSAGLWQYYGLYQSSYTTMPISLTPRISVPLPATGLTSGGTYHILMQQQGGDPNDYLRTHLDVDVFTGNPTLQTSPRGTYTWTAAAAGNAVPIQIYDQTAFGLPLHTWEDSGARVTTIVRSTTPDQRVLGLCEATRMGLGLNQNQGFESGLTPWTVSGGTLSQSTAQSYAGIHSAQITPSGSSAQVGLSSETLACLPGQSVTVAARLWFTSAVTTNASISVNWFTSGGAYITTSYNEVSVAATTWTQIANTFTAPATAYGFTINPTLGGTPAATQIWYVDNIIATYTYTGAQQSSVTEFSYASVWPATGAAPVLTSTTVLA